MDWDFIIAMAIVAITTTWLAYRLIRNAKNLRDVVQDKADMSALCKNCSMHDKCLANQADVKIKLSTRVRIKHED